MIEKTEVVSFRVTKEEREAIDRVAESRGQTMAVFIRAAIKRELGHDDIINEKLDQIIQAVSV